MLIGIAGRNAPNAPAGRAIYDVAPGRRAKERTIVQVRFTHDGQTFAFECFDNLQSAVVSQLVLNGTTYPHLPFVTGVEVLWDVGANCGATATWFSHVYPDARIIAFEPAERPYELLVANTDRLPNVTALPFGLHREDQECKLFHGLVDSTASSIFQLDGTGETSEVITLRSARQWYEESATSRLDVLKLDTEGCEVPILESLAEVLPSVKVIYLEFHSEADRRLIDDLLHPTHALFFGRLLGPQGELVYLQRELVPPSSTDLTDLSRSLLRI